MPAMSIAALVPKVAPKAKRPAWDLKGRVQDLDEVIQKVQQRNASLEKNLEETNGRIASLEAEKCRLNENVVIKSAQTEEASCQIQRLTESLKKKTEEFQEKEAEIRALKEQLETLQNSYKNLQQMYQDETSALKSSISSLTCSKSGLQAQLDATELMLENEKKETKLLRAKCSGLELDKESLIQSNSNLEAKLREGESERRILHNTVQELKGNIRVFCRIRPPLPEEFRKSMTLANIEKISEKTIEIQQTTDASLNENSTKVPPKHEFSFDCVFTSTASQKEVFNEISQLVQSSLDGYNVCIFAYGQTGSGKTFTMEGPADIVDFSSPNHESNLGMIPRSIIQIFQSISDLEPKGWKYRVESLFLEIYNERIQDLLNSQNCQGKIEIVKSGSKGTDCKLSNVTPAEVTSSQQVFELLKKARINRAVAATKCNEHSSRSHFIFQIKIFGENSITGEKCDGTLNLVDLAGSERVKESGSAGDRLTEAKAINKSLSTLGNVIMSLSRKETHIPYRDSKLTHLLANSLGGNSKTLMFVNISPENDSLSETINSLRFATKVNHCNIGTAQKRVK
ncbi:carboxy-terminal kinesin 2-like [Uloborus diversus]|uniref:carboxy-terminal kinesin 2-like n=1 Tax=Uloborus diversus TaxID=327109 RepID=UPI00240A3333|nr:carboxy-terminal kinesin 2-like [Uloborus diversus]